MIKCVRHNPRTDAHPASLPSCNPTALSKPPRQQLERGMLSISSGTGSHAPKCEVICKAALIKGMAVINGPKTCNLVHLTCNLPSVKLFHHIGVQVQHHRLSTKQNCSEPPWRGRVANTGLALLTGSPSKNQILDTSEISATIWSILKILISDSHGAGILNRQLQSTFYATRRLLLHLTLCLQLFNKLNVVKSHCYLS